MLCEAESERDPKFEAEAFRRFESLELADLLDMDLDMATHSDSTTTAADELSSGSESDAASDRSSNDYILDCDSTSLPPLPNALPRGELSAAGNCTSQLSRWANIKICQKMGLLSSARTRIVWLLPLALMTANSVCCLSEGFTIAADSVCA